MSSSSAAPVLAPAVQEELPAQRKLSALFPPSKWLRTYQPGWLKLDFLAGFTLAAYAIPVSLAYATLAGLPPVSGLYCYLVAGIGYMLLGTSRQLAIGPTSAISLVVGSTLAELTAGHPERLLPMATLSTLVVGVVFLLAWALRLSVIVNFISESILTGFKAGAAITIALTQLPKALGVKGGGHEFFERIIALVHQLGSTNLVVLAVAVTAIVLLVLGDKVLPNRPIALFVVILSLFAVPLFNLSSHGVKVAGQIPAGLPRLDMARFSLEGVNEQVARGMVQLAFACFLLAYIESISAARTFATKHKYQVGARQELLALGAANIFAGLFQGYPSAGGLSQSSVNEKAGARTPLSLLFASGVIAAVLIFLTGFFRNLPDAVLAAVVLVAVKGLIDIKEFRHLYRASRLDFYVALIALVAVLLLGILNGVVFAVFASLFMLIKQAATPHVAFLGKVPATDRFSDLARHPDNEVIPGVLVFRPEAALIYFNVDHVLAQVNEQLRAREDLSLVVCDLSNAPHMDLAGSRMLLRLHEQLTQRGIKLRVVEAHGRCRDLLRADGLDEKLGPITRKLSLADMIGLCENQSATPTGIVESESTLANTQESV